MCESGDGMSGGVSGSLTGMATAADSAKLGSFISTGNGHLGLEKEVKAVEVNSGSKGLRTAAKGGEQGGDMAWEKGSHGDGCWESCCSWEGGRLPTENETKEKSDKHEPHDETGQSGGLLCDAKNESNDTETENAKKEVHGVVAHGGGLCTRA
ncbi:hypothetical protein CLOM_g6755 [Closterium sp. NIES-68]|nr:hypothetical protein CLOM_g6755 [Closterium sp. NIES-68]